MKYTFKSLTFWLFVALVICAGVIYALADINAERVAEIVRLEDNQTTLLGEVEHYETENGRLAASVQVLTMKRDEFAELLKVERRKVENLGIRIAELESVGEVATSTDVTLDADIIPSDTIYIPEPIMGTFEWQDPWVRVMGELQPDRVRARINITDTITIVAHRKARGWWIFKCKGKITHYDAVSANPYTQINHIEYVEIRD